MLKFVNEDVEREYECLVDKDRKVEKLGIYSGPLSKITRKMARELVRGQSNLIREKAQTVTGNKAPEIEQDAENDEHVAQEER